MANSLVKPFQLRMFIGFLLQFIPIAGLLFDGYKIRCAQTFNSAQLPEWRDWGKMFLQGLGLRAIQVIYGLPTLAIVLWLALGFQVQDLSAAQLLTEVLLARNLFFLMIALLLVAAWFVPSAVLSYAFENRFGAAFSLGMLKRTATLAYLKSWLLSSAYALAIFAVIGLFAIFGSAPFAENFIGIMIFVAILYLLLTVSGITYWTMLAKGYYQTYARTGY